MRHFSFERFSVFGHDRGGRVTHRMALDHPEKSSGPPSRHTLTHVLFSRVDKAFAESAYHWFFFARPAPFPETVILNSLELFVGREGSECSAPISARVPHSRHACTRCVRLPRRRSIDFGTTRRISVRRTSRARCSCCGASAAPLRGVRRASAIWGERAARVSGKQMPGGPIRSRNLHRDETAAELRAFLAGSSE